MSQSDKAKQSYNLNYTFKADAKQR
jgi:hypothetical protein